MSILLIGDGPAVDAAEAMLADADLATTRGSMADLPGADLAIVVGLAGSEGFETANDQAMASETPWIAVEMGGIGGVPRADRAAAVTTFQPGYVCYDCLQTRVQAGDPEPAEEARAERPAAFLAGAYAGLQAIRAFSEAEVAGTVIEVPYAERSLLPVPGCRHAPEQSRDLSLDESERSLDAAVGAAETAVDDTLGIVRQVGEQASFPLPYYLSVLGDTTGFSDGSGPTRAAGVAVSWDRAFMKALGESLERYSAAIYRTPDLERTASTDVDGPALDAYASITDAAVEAAERVPVVQGTDLRTEDSVSLPADLVYFPPPSGALGQPITTGLGLGNGGVEAVLSGLYETIERDATMLAWYSTFEPLALAVEDDTFAEMARRARGADLSITPLLVTQDVDVPVVAVAVHRDSYPRLALGSAADLDAEAAAVDALAEAIQNWTELQEMGPEAADEAGGAIGRYATDPGPATSLLDPEGSVPAATVGPETVPDGRAELDAVLDAMDAAGLDAYAVDLTPRDVARLGFQAVRVLSPGAQPLFVDDPVFGERASNAPLELGFEPRLDRAFHPYP